MLLAADPPAGFVLFSEHLVPSHVPAFDVANLPASPVLQAGGHYFIRVTGSVTIDTLRGLTADAEYAHSLGDDPWNQPYDKRPTHSMVDYGLGIDDAVPDTIKTPHWDGDGDGLPNPADGYAYGLHWVGRGTSHVFSFHDDKYDDNYGNLTVRIYAPPPTAAVVQLTYDATSIGYHHNLLDDYDQSIYAGPHWLDGNEDGDAEDASDSKLPTDFVSGATMRVSATFKLDLSGSPSSVPLVQIRGTGPAGISFPAVAAPVFNGYAMTTNHTATVGFAAGTIDYFPALPIEWEASLDDGVTWNSAGTTQNEIAVLLGQPLAENTLTLSLTPVMLGTKAADGESDAAGATAKVWAEFSDREVFQEAQPAKPGQPARDRRQLTYWKSDYVLGPPARHNNRTSEAMRASESGDGDCFAWSELFIDALKAQGINGAEKVYVVSAFDDGNLARPARRPTPSLMLFNNWTFDDPPNNPRNDGWDYREGEHRDAPGMPAQGNDDPIFGSWNTHMIVRYDGKFYDPSYGGEVRANREEWENATLAGTLGYRAFFEGGQLTEVRAARKNVALEKEVEFLDGPWGLGGRELEEPY